MAVQLLFELMQLLGGWSGWSGVVQEVQPRDEHQQVHFRTIYESWSSLKWDPTDQQRSTRRNPHLDMKRREVCSVCGEGSWRSCLAQMFTFWGTVITKLVCQLLLLLLLYLSDWCQPWSVEGLTSPLIQHLRFIWGPFVSTPWKLLCFLPKYSSCRLVVRSCLVQVLVSICMDCYKVFLWILILLFKVPSIIVKMLSGLVEQKCC